MITNVLISKLGRSQVAHVTIAALVWLFAGAARPAAAQEPRKQEAAKRATATPADGFKWTFYEGRSEIEIGYRWVSEVTGNYEMYRSMVNLGEGPKVLRTSLSLRSNYGSGGLFDRLDLEFNNWGGEPYNTMRLNLSRADLYEFRADYRNLNYYNFIPTFANPLLGKGKLLNQHGLNVTNRSTDLQLKLFPNRKVRPYVAYARSTGFGPGFTTYGLTGNEFLVHTRWQHAADDYRGGVELALPKLGLTLEQGVRLLKNDTSVVSGEDHSGNVSRPFLGQTIVLNSLNRGYHDRTTIPVTKALVKFTPTESLQITGRYIYSMADLTSEMNEIDVGNLASLEDRLFYRANADAFNSRSKRPNHHGGFTIEFSPHRRLSLIDQFDTRSFHVSGSAVLSSVFFQARPLSGAPGPIADRKIAPILDSVLAYDQVRNQADAELDLGYGLSIHGGHRYTYAETTLRDSEGKESYSRTSSLTMQTGTFGFGFRRGRRVNLSLEYEENQPEGGLTRTDLLDYYQVKFSWSVGLGRNLNATGRVATTRNRNNMPDINFRSHNRNYTVGVTYEPNERFALSLDYARSNLLSAIDILLPQTFDLDRSIFDERGHTVGGSMGIGIYRGSRIDLGYRGMLNVGSFPLNYHQPYASLSIPLQKHLAFKTYWQYFGYNEKGASFQDYRGHLVTYALAFSY